MLHNPYRNIEFEGKQDGEVVLFLIQPHWLMLVSRVAKTLFRFALLALTWWAMSFWKLNAALGEYLSNYELRGYILIAAAFIADLAWQFRFYYSYKAFITDRRIVVVKSVFPITIKRQTLFWKDAVKGRDIASNFVWRMLKIGTLEISAKLFQGFDVQHAKGNPLGSEIQIKFVKNFVEITNYIDNLIHLTSLSPEKTLTVSPLIFKNNYQSQISENSSKSVKES